MQISGEFQVLKTTGQAGNADYEEICTGVKTDNNTNIIFCNGNGSTPTEVSFDKKGNPVFKGSNYSGDTAFLNSKLYNSFNDLVGEDGVLDESDLNKAKSIFGDKIDISKLKDEGIVTFKSDNGSYFTVDIYTKAEKSFDDKLKEETTSTISKACKSALKFLWNGFANWMDRNTEQWERSTAR